MVRVELLRGRGALRGPAGYDPTAARPEVGVADLRGARRDSLHSAPTRAKLAQILRNFLSNAVKFTERGEIRVAAAAGPDDTVDLSVTDTGIGIAAEDLPRIFEEFGQVENHLQRRIKGTGLGLPLSRKLAELLGGSVSVRSEPGVGSTFFA